MNASDALAGKTVEGFTIREHGFCEIKFSGDVMLTQESLLRFVGEELFISAEDHHQNFGLNSPYDAESAIKEKILGQVVKRVEVVSETSDLILHLGNGRVEIICSSTGYEAYQIYCSGELAVLGRGGVLNKS